MGTSAMMGRKDALRTRTPNICWTNTVDLTVRVSLHAVISTTPLTHPVVFNLLLDQAPPTWPQQVVQACGVVQLSTVLMSLGINQ